MKAWVTPGESINFGAIIKELKDRGVGDGILARN